MPRSSSKQGDADSVHRVKEIDSKVRVRMYLDIDDTLVRFPDDYNSDGTPGPTRGTAADGAREFVLWAHHHFDLHWLTTWFPSERKRTDRVQRLARKLGLEASLVRAIPHTKFFVHMDGHNEKCVELSPRDPWIWVEDEHHGLYEYQLKKMGRSDDFYVCNVTTDPTALAKVKAQLCLRFGLPA